MVTLIENLSSMLGLLGTACFMIVIGLITAEFAFSKLKGPKRATVAKVIVGVVLGVLAIFGTLWGMKLADGTVINVRELASMIAGAAGGPIAWHHRRLNRRASTATPMAAQLQFHAQSQPYSSASLQG